MKLALAWILLPFRLFALAFLLTADAIRPNPYSDYSARIDRLERDSIRQADRMRRGF